MAQRAMGAGSYSGRTGGESANTLSPVTPEEFESIRREGLFQTRRIDSMELKRSSTLVNAQHELAFRKRRVRDEAGDPETDSLVLGWREESRRLRTEWT